MIRDFGLGVAATTYFFGSRLSHFRSCTWGCFGVDSIFCATMCGCSFWRYGEGVISLSISKQENRLCTGSGGARFTHCEVQNPLLPPRGLPQPRWLFQFQIMGFPLCQQEPGALVTTPVSLPYSWFGCQRIGGSLGHSVQVYGSNGRVPESQYVLGFGQLPLELGLPSEL